jgi:uncharacterized integral membrane protein (TIGR00697 family)
VNEFLFFAHVLLVVGFVFAAARLSKNSLIALIALQGVLANLFVVKQMSLFGFSVTCSDVFSIGSILALNLLQEYYGRDAAQGAVKISLFCLVFFACMAWFHLLYRPLGSDPFVPIFSSTPRIVAASIGVFYLVQQVDVRLFGWLRGKLAVRIAFSLLIAQLLDTALFSLLGLYGLVESLFDIILVSYFAKGLIIATSSTWVACFKRWVKHVPL